jgi:hypothetical protein
MMGMDHPQDSGAETNYRGRGALEQIRRAYVTRRQVCAKTS